MEKTFLIVSCANSQSILEKNLLLSPDVQSGELQCRPIFEARSAGSAYAGALDDSVADVLIFLHQDVYLPRGWFALLRDAIAILDVEDPDWAVIGSYGATQLGQHAGYIYDVCNARLLGTPVEAPTRVAILDEIVIVVRRLSGVNFDPNLPGFHMYGTQIGLAAAERGKGVYVAHLPVVHNSRSIETLDRHFGEAWSYISKKWRGHMPVPNLMCKFMDGTVWPLWKWRLRNKLLRLRNKRILYPRVPDPRVVARDSGFE